MTEHLTWFLSVVVVGIVGGLALGFAYFGGLWLTVRRAAQSERPALLVMLSFLGRSLFLFGGFALMALDGSWARVVIAAAACIAVRFAMQRRLAPAPGREGGAPCK